MIKGRRTEVTMDEILNEQAKVNVLRPARDLMKPAPQPAPQKTKFQE